MISPSVLLVESTDKMILSNGCKNVSVFVAYCEHLAASSRPPRGQRGFAAKELAILSTSETAGASELQFCASPIPCSKGGRA